MDLDLRKLRSFVCVAERLSFVHAAAELHLTQPALTRQIQALEHELGVSLFVRDRRGTALTGPGRQLLEDARTLLDSATGVERRARAAARGPTEFVVGFMPGVPATQIIREYRERAPHVVVDVVYVPMDEQEPYLHDGRVDVSFVRLPVHSRALQTIALFAEPKVVVLPANSPFVDALAVDLDDLRPLPFLDDPASAPAWRGDVVPRRRPYANVEERLEAVASGAGFTILPAGIAGYHRRDDVVAVPVRDIAPVTIALAYPRHRTMPEIAHFAQIARRQLGPREAHGGTPIADVEPDV